MRDPRPSAAAPRPCRGQSRSDRLSRALAGYRAEAARLKAVYDAVDPAEVLAPVIDAFPAAARVLDIGAGTGVQAAWLAGRGHAVTAVEPTIELRSHDVNWITAQLPSLTGVSGAFDVILLSAVWHHLTPAARAESWKRLAELLAPGGVIVMSLRHGPCPAARPCWPITLETELQSAAAHGFTPTFIEQSQSVQAANREAGVTWNWLGLKQSPRARAKA